MVYIEIISVVRSGIRFFIFILCFHFNAKLSKSFCCSPWKSSGTLILFPSCMILFCTFSSSDVGALGKSIQKSQYLSNHLVWCQQKRECWTKLNCDPLYALIQKNSLTEVTGSCKIHQMQFSHLLEPKSLNCIWKCAEGEKTSVLKLFTCLQRYIKF